jgi:hypothetical protein
MAMF